MRTSLLLAAGLLLSMTLHAQSTPDDLEKAFFATYVKDPAQAVADVYAISPWTARLTDAIDRIKKEVDSYTPDYMGEYCGYESIVRKEFASSFVLHAILVKYTRQPLRFTFEWYKPKDKWLLFSFKIDGDLDDEIEEAAKLYRLEQLR